MYSLQNLQQYTKEQVKALNNKIEKIEILVSYNLEPKITSQGII